MITHFENRKEECDFFIMISVLSWLINGQKGGPLFACVVHSDPVLDVYGEVTDSINMH